MRFLKFYTLPVLTLVVGGLFLMPACKKTSSDDPTVVTEGNLAKTLPNNVVYDWNELFLQIERYAAGYRPGPAPRAIAYLGLKPASPGCPGTMPLHHSTLVWLSRKWKVASSITGPQ